MITTRTNRSLLAMAIAFTAITGASGLADAQGSACNAMYDDGIAVSASYFEGHQSGDPDKMFAVRFDLADFGYEPGKVEITGRTFNQSPDGTFGQFLPGVAMDEALCYGHTGVLSQLTKNGSFRTNIGFINLSDKQCKVRVTLRDAMGTPIGNTRTLNIAPSGWKQDTDIFTRAGAGEQANSYATVEVLTEDCKVWGYASIVDEGTGDPTTIPIAVR
jgi:hypothetical protein